MKEHIYLRVSTEEQDFGQQKEMIKKRVSDLDSGKYEYTVEKISGSISYKDRKLSQLINKCETGDIIYISELSRFGRSMADVFQSVNECCAKGVVIIECKSGTQIENESIAGKALLFALSLAAEIELKNIRERTRAGLLAKKKLGVKFGKANANYTYNEEAQKKGAEKASIAKITKAMMSRETLLICRSLKRYIPDLAEQSTYNDDLFFKVWNTSKIKLTKDIKEKVLQDLFDYKADDNSLFTKYDINESKETLMPKMDSRIRSIFKTIKMFNEINK